MAVTVTDNRTIKNEADATTGWTSAGTSTGVATGTASPTPREATAHIVTTATSNTPANQWLWHTGASLGTGPHLIYIWMLTSATIGTRANGGLMILIGDGSNRVGYHVGGDDFAPFRVDSNGLVGYMCFCIDTAQLSTWANGHTVQAGTRAGLEANLNAITQIGTGCQVLAKALAGAVNYWNDIIRHGVASTISTSGLTISGGTSGTPGKFTEIEVEDRATANQKAHGIIRELGTGVFGVQGTLRFGDQGTGSSWFEETNVTIIFEDRGFATTRYKIFISDNGTGTTTFRLGTKVGTGVTATGENGVTISAASGIGWEFDADTDTDVTDVFLYGSTLNGASGGVGFRVGHEFIGGIISASGAVRSGGATMVNSKVVGSLAAANTSALIWNVATDPDGYLDGTSYSKGTAAHHAIEFGLTSPTSITLRGIDFTGFSATNNVNDSTFHIRRTTGTVTINVVNCVGNFGYRTDGATVVIVSNPVTLTLTVQDNSGDPIENARALVTAGTGGPFPGDVTVTITTVTTTATVAHTAHGLANGNRVLIRGANENELNGIHTISNVSTNAYDYTITSIGGASGTGTIKSSFVIISGLTNVSGVISDTRTYSADQLLGTESRVRKSSSSPYYKTGPVVGTVSSAAGASITIVLLDDE